MVSKIVPATSEHSVADGRVCIGTVATNLDHSVNAETAERLKVEPNTYAWYTARDFCSYVIWNGNKWECEVWQHHQKKATFIAGELNDIMADVSSVYGQA